jgi:hypothetical protein
MDVAVEVLEEPLSERRRQELLEKFALTENQFLRDKVSSAERLERLTKLADQMEMGLDEDEIKSLRVTFKEILDRESKSYQRELANEKND